MRYDRVTNILHATSRFGGPIVIVDIDYPGTRVPERMQGMAQGTKLTLDLTFQTPGVRWDSQWRWFSFGPLIDRAFIPEGSVVMALDKTTGAVLTAERVH